MIRLNETYIFNNVDSESILLNQKNNETIFLNETATCFMNNLIDKEDFNDSFKQIKHIFVDVEEVELQKDIRNFLEDFIKQGILYEG